jgi:hypothetical protein
MCFTVLCGYISTDEFEIGGALGEEGFEHGLCVSLAGRAVGEGMAQFFQGVVTEEELEEG